MHHFLAQDVEGSVGGGVPVSTGADAGAGDQNAAAVHFHHLQGKVHRDGNVALRRAVGLPLKLPRHQHLAAGQRYDLIRFYRPAGKQGSTAEKAG